MGTASTAALSAREAEQVRAANESGRVPVVFVHGLWLLADSWDHWRDWFEERGYVAVAIDWPGDQPSVSDARANPDSLAGRSVTELVEHLADVVASLQRQPVVVGHSFGGLLAQMVAGRGLAAASVVIDSAPSKGVLRVPLSTVKASFPVLGNPRNAKRTVTLTFDQFRYGFANAIAEAEARALYDRFHVPAPGRPLFQAATANLNPWATTKVDPRNPERGPMLIVSGDEDNIVPSALSNAAYKRQRRNKQAATELVTIPGAGHSLVIDRSWQQVAQVAVDFLDRQGQGA